MKDFENALHFFGVFGSPTPVVFFSHQKEKNGFVRTASLWVFASLEKKKCACLRVVRDFPARLYPS